MKKSSLTKKQIRANFRKAVFTRDKFKCVICGKTGDLDAHHIINPKEIPNSGYVLENGITLCCGQNQDNCHWKAEQFHATGISYPGYSPQELFEKIGSSHEKAIEASEKL